MDFLTASKDNLFQKTHIEPAAVENGREAARRRWAELSEFFTSPGRR